MGFVIPLPPRIICLPTVAPKGPRGGINIDGLNIDLGTLGKPPTGNSWINLGRDQRRPLGKPSVCLKRLFRIRTAWKSLLAASARNSRAFRFFGKSGPNERFSLQLGGNNGQASAINNRSQVGRAMRRPLSLTLDARLTRIFRSVGGIMGKRQSPGASHGRRRSGRGRIRHQQSWPGGRLLPGRCRSYNARRNCGKTTPPSCFRTLEVQNPISPSSLTTGAKLPGKSAALMAQPT